MNNNDEMTEGVRRSQGEIALFLFDECKKLQSDKEVLQKALDMAEAELKSVIDDKERLVKLAEGNITACGTCATIIKEARKKL